MTSPPPYKFSAKDFFWRYWPWPIRVLVVIAVASFALATYSFAVVQVDIRQHESRDAQEARSADAALCVRVQRLRDQTNLDSVALFKLARHDPDIAALLNYLPATNCIKAVRDPEHYLPPPPVPLVRAKR